MPAYSEALDKHTCAACGTTRKATHLRYDPTTFLPYCQHAEICAPAHPNSPTSILERGQGINLVTLSEAEKLYREKLLIEHPDAEAVEQIRKLLEKPISLRVLSPDLAKYLVQVQKEYSMDTMAETIRYLLSVAMESHGHFYKDRKAVQEEQVKQEIVEKAVKEVERPLPDPEPEEPEQDEESEELIF